LGEKKLRASVGTQLLGTAPSLEINILCPLCMLAFYDTTMPAARVLMGQRRMPAGMGAVSCVSVSTDWRAERIPKHH